MLEAYGTHQKRVQRSFIISRYKELVLFYGTKYCKMVVVDHETMPFVSQALTEGVPPTAITVVNYEKINVEDMPEGLTFKKMDILDMKREDLYQVGVVWIDLNGTNRFAEGSWKRNFDAFFKVPYLFQTTSLRQSTFRLSDRGKILEEVKLLHEHSGKRHNTTLSLYKGMVNAGVGSPKSPMLFAWSTRIDFSPPSPPPDIIVFNPNSPTSSIPSIQKNKVQKVKNPWTSTKKRKPGRKPNYEAQLKEDKLMVEMLFRQGNKSRWFNGSATKIKGYRFEIVYEDGSKGEHDLLALLKRKDGKKIRIVV